MDYFPINDRLKGMLKVFNYYDVDIKTGYVDFDSSIMTRKIQIAQVLNHQTYDAICCTDDLTAILVKEYTASQNYYPVITGFDGSTLIKTLFPDLISVHQSISEITDSLVSVLLKRIEKPKQEVKMHKIIPIQF